MIAIEDRKQNRFVDAKTVWSVRTRAAMVRFGEAVKLIRRERKANQVVAAGPKTAGVRLVVVLVVVVGTRDGGKRKMGN